VAQLIHLTENGRLDFSRSISDVLPLEQAAEAVERLEHKKGDPIRLVLRP
ncbi:zinc-binding dehydrogenase, partial [Streptomyces sp. NPDC057927]